MLSYPPKIRNNDRVGHTGRESCQKNHIQCFRKQTYGSDRGFLFFLLCKATIELHPDLSLLQQQEKMSNTHTHTKPKQKQIIFCIFAEHQWHSEFRGSESCIMNEWVSNGNWEPKPSTPGFSDRGPGGGRAESHIFLHPGVWRKESCN